MTEIAASDEQMQALGAGIASQLTAPEVVYLNGPLGAGKTTLVRGLLRALGIEGAIRSPTYTLVESYRASGMDLWHFDLYRIDTIEELEVIGARECFSSSSICLIEWPDKGTGFVPSPSMQIDISFDPVTEQRAVNVARPGLAHD